MTINEKIHKIRIDKNMSQAELAYKSECSISDIIRFESNGTMINAYALLKIIDAFEITLIEFRNHK